MPVEKGPVLRLKGLSAVMFTLPLRRPNYIWQLGLADCEATISISILPGKGASAKRLVVTKNSIRSSVTVLTVSCDPAQVLPNAPFDGLTNPRLAVLG